MINVLNEVKAEDKQAFAYLDEKIASNIYYCSLSTALRAIDNYSVAEREKRNKNNQWLLNETADIKNVPVLSFDNIIRKLNNGMKSCDAFFYCFTFEEGDRHFLVEFKNDSKSAASKLLKSSDDDCIYEKVNDSVKAILNELEFGGNQEHADVVAHTHFIYVYSGKNDVPAVSGVSMKLPRKNSVSRDKRGKQNKAAKADSHKELDQTYATFENKLEKIGLESCSEKILPGKAIPRVRKRGVGADKVRQFSMFSSSDFAELINSGYFIEWKWGDYSPYFK